MAPATLRAYRAATPVGLFHSPVYLRTRSDSLLWSDCCESSDLLDVCEDPALGFGISGRVCSTLGLWTSLVDFRLFLWLCFCLSLWGLHPVSTRCVFAFRRGEFRSENALTMAHLRFFVYFIILWVWALNPFFTLLIVVCVWAAT